MCLGEFVHCNLPLAAQQMLMKNPETRIRAALASSPLTDINIVNALAHDKSLAVRNVAHLRTTDVDVLATALRDLLKRACKRPTVTYANAEGAYAARNANAPVELLAQALSSNNENVALNAYCNPSTPETERRKITPKRAIELTEFEMWREDQTVRSAELVRINPWMSHNAPDWSSKIKGAIVGSPTTSDETLTQLLELGYWDNTMRNRLPEEKYSNIATSSIEELIPLGHVATHLEAMNRPEFSVTHAKQMLVGYSRRGSADAYVVGRIVNRYGAGLTFNPGANGRTPRLSLKIVAGATWLAPVLEYPDALDHSQHIRPLQDAATTLGESSEHWETFLELAQHWHGTLVSAAQAAKKL